MTEKQDSRAQPVTRGWGRGQLGHEHGDMPADKFAMRGGKQAFTAGIATDNHSVSVEDQASM